MKYDLTEENIKSLCEKAHHLLCPQCDSEHCGWLWEKNEINRKDDYWIKNFSHYTLWDLETHKNWLRYTKRFIATYSIYTIENLLESIEETPVSEKLRRCLYGIISN